MYPTIYYCISQPQHTFIVILVKPIQEGQLRQQLKDVLPVVILRGDVTVKQVQPLQTLEVFLQEAE